LRSGPNSWPGARQGWYLRAPMSSGETTATGAPTPPARAPDCRPPETRAEKLNTKAAGIVAVAVMCSRVLGLIRDQIFAALFGGGRLMDAFTIAFRIPNLLRDLFAEGALSAAFVTTFSKTTALEGDASAWHLANKVATLAIVVLSANTILAIVFAPWLVT